MGLGIALALAVVGPQYPLQMLPLFRFGRVWKSIGLVVVALPLRSAHGTDAESWATASACRMGVIFPVVGPWRYVLANFVMQPAGRWH